MQLAILAADFTPGEADQLRRAMAAWKRKGGLGPFHERLVGRMVAKGYEREYAERIFKQIEGFGEYGFPESHAASFALLVYVSAWLKCHHPDAFLAALLNSQPMGFYAPAQLVRDAREHGVAVLPVDVARSDWDSDCSEAGGSARPAAAGAAGLQPHQRLRGRAAAAAAWRRAPTAPFASPEDLARRAALDAARAGAAGAGRRAGADHRPPPPGGLGRGRRRHARHAAAAGHAHARGRAALPAPGAAEDVLADYRSTGLSLTQHPVALLRAQLAAFKVQPAAVLRGYPHGQLARASGIVTHRQRPETAKGVVFVTLEDETGSVNVIVWPDGGRGAAQAAAGAARCSPSTASGSAKARCAGGHLMARKLVDHSALLQGLATRSRNFR